MRTDNEIAERCGEGKSQRLPQLQLDLLADLLWWVKGAVDNDAYDFPFHEGHVEALRCARVIGSEDRCTGKSADV